MKIQWLDMKPVCKSILNKSLCIHNSIFFMVYLGEALGAIGDSSEHILELLKKHSSDKYETVSETCQIALKRLEWLQKQKDLNENLSENPYYSVDPAPPTDLNVKVNDLKAKLLDESDNLFERYRAMFALRNIGSDESILALCEGYLKLKSIDNSD